MARQCIVCGKGYTNSTTLVKLRGKFNPTAKYRRYPNLQWVFIPLETNRKKFKEFAGKRIKACTECIKAIGKGN
ncbi:MAG: hypothetical protein A2365_04325 [Candidatus Nealsonbacteria bacterium RIFOXYB1_FULL_40_15]|uniref:50S ribosomal protein L28 n=2 Tax=Candidatus Nealsoniibacteriota TaxID=1817911 RepID=A0A1G2EM80_9BACT|nr:MAG: hypothetical protein A2427_04190 [Candidatus Nealsonbacteria bacterium RIFOXYC1_FULL_40_7]OGZ27829.1 MAG: hypothetical protein A2365_04325 [Candidatus Nealsonbacteria bacterium RIFOXYB1_FULL_40_15]OGZ28919.1 MAG: hypothetical protein A2562_04045 [Candidatus Nealsonbacteria bacterium RIFOXYD1_FULL_39_11]